MKLSISPNALGCGLAAMGESIFGYEKTVKVFVIEAKPNPNISFGEDLPNPPAASASATSSRLRRSFPGPELSSKPNAMV